MNLYQADLLCEQVFMRIENQIPLRGQEVALLYLQRDLTHDLWKWQEIIGGSEKYALSEVMSDIARRLGDYQMVLGKLEEVRRG